MSTDTVPVAVDTGVLACCGGYAEHFLSCPERRSVHGCQCSDCQDGRIYEQLGDDVDRVDGPADATGDDVQPAVA